MTELEILKGIGDYGAIAIIFAWFIYWYFKNTREKKEPFNGMSKLILDEMKKQNENHLEHIQSGINEGFSQMRDCQERQTTRLCEKLDILIMAIGELKGRLK